MNPSNIPATPLVYVVDDEPLVCMVLETAVLLSGCQVRAFTDPCVARDAFFAADAKPAILVSDLRMPGLRGNELIRLCQEVAPRLKTILISGYTDERELIGVPCRPDLLLPKPFTAHDLIRAIQDLLRTGAPD